MDVKLDPALQDKCLIDLGKWCSEKTETGQVSDSVHMLFLKSPWRPAQCLLVGFVIFSVFFPRKKNPSEFFVFISKNNYIFHVLMLWFLYF